MALIKVSEVAKRAEVSVGDAIKKLQLAGFSVSGADDTVSEEDAAAAGLEGGRHSQLDRRQEMLKKALERHKRGVKIKEVVVNKNSPLEPQQGRKLSKEELMKKRSELDQRIRKVDEERENISRERAEAPVQPKAQEAGKADSAPEAPAEAAASAAEQTAPEISKTMESAAQKPSDIPAPQAQERQKPQPAAESRPRTSYETYQRPARSQGESRVQKNDGTQFARPYTPRPQGERNDGTQFARPYTPRPQGERNDGTQFARPYSPRPQGERPYGQRSDRPQGERPYGQRGGQGDRPYAPRAGQQGDKGGYGDRPYGQGGRGGAGRPGGPLGGPRIGGEGLSLTAEEERKRLIKKKEDDAAKEKEAKKPKAKKDAVKKPKSWSKTITEGLDELNIEKEVEHKTISPNIDISDLADVDPDRKPKNQTGFKGRFGGKPKKRGDSAKSAQKVFVRPDKVEIGERIVISDLGSLIGVKATELTKKLFGMGIMATVNQSIDAESAQLLGMEYGVDVTVKTVTEDDLLPVYEDKPEELEKRPPIVTVMGHVDHGKTSLLDAIRSTSVAVGEAGGITQHIGAYEVESASGKVIFLDTPGHEAFTTLRARGALLTDIVILVVAADDGVKPQTKEAIDHAKAAGVRIVVAINKIDKEGANPDKVRQQLAEHGIIGDDWGGDYQFQNISAKKRIGIDDLLERVLLEAEVLDLKGNPNRPAEGVVIESRLDKQKGPVATVLVKNGTLRKGDTFISGSQFGKVRAMFNFKGASMKEAGLSIPAEVMGFSSLPDAGEKFIVADDKVIKQVAELRAAADRERQHAERGKLSLADLFGKIQDGELKELNIVLKADAQGSVEALSASLRKLSNQEVKVNIIHDGIGAVTESDVALAAASKAIIIGFNVRPDNKARAAADKENINIELYSVIYKAIDDVKMALEGLLSPEMKESVVGRVEIRQVFSVPKIGKIAGCFVTEGKVHRNSSVRIIRDSIVIFDGKIGSLKRFTDDVKEVVAGYECGLSVEKYQDIKEGDVLEVYEVTEEKRTLEDVARSEATEKAKQEAAGDK